MARQNTIVNFFAALISYITNTNLFNPNGVKFVIDPDSIKKWPATPPPLCLVEPREFDLTGDDIGGGRYQKVWTPHISIHIVTANIYDISWEDTILATSRDTSTGPYQLVDVLINALEQSYITNPDGSLCTIEFPRVVRIESPRRYQGSNEYIGLPVVFQFTFQQDLPNVTAN